MSAHRFEFVDIDGNPLPLSAFRDKAVLLVTTASRSEFAAQLRGLQNLWERYKDRGLVVVGVPCNDFGAEEPGTDSEIKRYTALNFGVNFPLTKKEKVTGDAAHPFFQWVVEEMGESPEASFEKYLIGPTGDLLAAWPAAMRPVASEVTRAIDAIVKSHPQSA